MSDVVSLGGLVLVAAVVVRWGYGAAYRARVRRQASVAALCGSELYLCQAVFPRLPDPVATMLRAALVNEHPEVTYPELWACREDALVDSTADQVQLLCVPRRQAQSPSVVGALPLQNGAPTTGQPRVRVTWPGVCDV